MVFEKKRRHLERYIEIGRVLAGYGWSNLIHRVGMADLFHLRGQPKGVPPGPVQVRETLEQLGPAFIKLGQVLSTRPDLIPPEYASELEKLQDSAPAVPIEEIRQVIEEELGNPPDSVFAAFDEQPLGSASLGQTHLATLHDGRDVVVKIQRPAITDKINTDLEIIAGIAGTLERHLPNLRVYALPELVDEFDITIHQELDYTREGRNGDQLRENLSQLDYVKIASTIWDYTTPRVLTSERLCGVKITDLDGLASRGYDRSAIANNLWRAFLKMVFVDGLFHGDPHPGNIVVLEDCVIGLLDYGMVGRLDRDLKTYITMLLSEYVQQDSFGFSEVLLAMGTKPPDLNRRAFSHEIDRLLRQYYGAPLKDLRMGEVLRGAIRISAKYRVRLPASMGLLIKVILGVDGIDRLLDSEYDLTSEARQFIRRSVREEFRPEALRDQLVHSLMYWKWLILELPHRAHDVLDNMAEGSFRIIFRHEGLEDATRDIDRSANRLSLAVLASATIVGSALVTTSRVGPVWQGLPVIGVLGFMLSFIFAMSLMISIVRSNKLW